MRLAALRRCRRWGTFRPAPVGLAAACESSIRRAGQAACAQGMTGRGDPVWGRRPAESGFGPHLAGPAGDVCSPPISAIPDYFHKVVDCQWACPAHTPVPEYIRLIAARRYTEAWAVNWESNVFPGILGRTCDRPCEPACRRGRIEKEPVAICRLKRVAADNKGDVSAYMPADRREKNGKRIALHRRRPGLADRGARPRAARLRMRDVRRRRQGRRHDAHADPALPPARIGHRRRGRPDPRHGRRDPVRRIRRQPQGAAGRRLGRGLRRLAARRAAASSKFPAARKPPANIHIGIDWLSSVSFGHIDKIGKRVIVLGGGNTAMDCCRSSRRLGGEEVTVVVRSGFEEMKASPWEKEDATHEGIPILNMLVPNEFTARRRQADRRLVREGRGRVRRQGRRKLVPTGEPTSTSRATTSWWRSARRTPSRGSSATSAWSSTAGTCPRSIRRTMQSTIPNVFFGGDAAFGPKNIIWAVAHGHDAAISIDKFCHGEDIGERPPPRGDARQPEDGHPRVELRQRHLQRPALQGAAARHGGGARGYHASRSSSATTRSSATSRPSAASIATSQTVFTGPLCIECDACVDICPVDCITFTDNGDEDGAAHAG